MNTCGHKDIDGVEVIISLTTYPKRMETLPIVLMTLFSQTVMPSRIILWLASVQYPNKVEVYDYLKTFIDAGLEIEFREDLRSHKKYYYSMKEHPESLIITVDDDIFYPEDMVETLLHMHKLYPDCIVTYRAHKMKFENGVPAPYSEWNTLARGCFEPSIDLCATGGAGCLYPPGSLSEHVLDKDIFMDICPYADDIWMKCMSFLNGTKVALAGKDNPEIITVYLQDDDGGLAKKNIGCKKNDEQLKKVTAYYQIKWDSVDKDIIQ